MSFKLAVTNLSKSFGNLPVLNSINIFVKEGEFVSIIGPSGCGKSTLFTIIAGVEEQSGGQIAISNQVTNLRAGTCGYNPQSPLLLPWRTVLDNVLLGADIKHINNKETKQKALSYLNRFGLSDVAYKYPSTLSGGMKQRVALLRTILFRQDLLLLDEPFGSLDALTRLSCQVWLQEVWEKFHSSVLFVTHDVREAILLSDRIYVLSDRPAHVIKEVKIPFSRPRHRTVLTKKAVLQLEQELEHILMKEQQL